MTGTLDVVVLAGGAGRRMGGDKARIVLDEARAAGGPSTRNAAAKRSSASSLPCASMDTPRAWFHTRPPIPRARAS